MISYAGERPQRIIGFAYFGWIIAKYPIIMNIL